MEFRGFAALVLLGLFSACGQKLNTGVLPLGPDTYRVQVARSTSVGGGVEAQRVALTQAREYCARQQKKFIVVGTQKSGGLNPNTHFQVDFRCLRPGDPGLGRPTLEPVPDVVIEDRR